jgi:hypothetical protein
MRIGRADYPHARSHFTTHLRLRELRCRWRFILRSLLKKQARVAPHQNAIVNFSARDTTHLTQR